MCITSVECKTFLTVVLTVKRGMDPHTIRWNLRCVWFGWEFGQSYCLGQSTIVDSLVCSMSLFQGDEN
jgi:hypothetical protein